MKDPKTLARQTRYGLGCVLVFCGLVIAWSGSIQMFIGELIEATGNRIAEE